MEAEKGKALCESDHLKKTAEYALLQANVASLSKDLSRVIAATR